MERFVAVIALALVGCAQGSVGSFGAVGAAGGGGAPEAESADAGAHERGEAPICSRYLGCLAAHPNDDAPGAIDAFGPGSDCWTGDPSQASACARACRKGALALPECGECDADADCEGDAVACVDHRCEPSGCRIDARRVDLLVSTVCACAPDCSAEENFLRTLASNAANADCGGELAAWAECQTRELVCAQGFDPYDVCAATLLALTTCENRGVSLGCPH